METKQECGAGKSHPWLQWGHVRVLAAVLYLLGAENSLGSVFVEIFLAWRKRVG